MTRPLDDVKNLKDWAGVLGWLDAGPDAWARLDALELEGLHFLACAETARAGGRAPGAPHQALFAHLVEKIPGDARWQIIQRTHAALVGTSGLVAPLFPFFLLDPELDLAAAAASYIVDVWTPQGADPLESPRAVARIGLASPEPRVRAATIGMLVGFGDLRLRELWREPWRGLPRAQRKALWEYLNVFRNTEVIECLLGWLERGPRADSAESPGASAPSPAGSRRSAASGATSEARARPSRTSRSRAAGRSRSTAERSHRASARWRPARSRPT